MAITLTHPTAGVGGTPLAVTLPPDLIWDNEFAWRQVEQITQYTGTGALVVDQWSKQAGRPMTLKGDATYGWALRSLLNTLNAWAAQTELQLTLLRNGTSWTVIFDQAASAIEAEPIVPYSDPEDGDQYAITLRFLIL
ncbi:MAG: hypothetical protein NDI93_06980 [Pseudomonas sp.]|nr:hypothetical protein [Pseudomonas sp.]